MKTTLVVAAALERAGQVLLVEQRGPDDPAPSWGLPGGVVEAGEDLRQALRREVREEIGLELAGGEQLVYALQHVEAEAGRQTLAFVFAAPAPEGEPTAADPDGLILRLRFWPRLEAALLIERHLPWRTMREPLAAWLRGEAGAAGVWLYRGPQMELAAVLGAGRKSSGPAE